jgi:hypothetical protein
MYVASICISVKLCVKNWHVISIKSKLNAATHKSLQRCVMNKFLEVHQKRPGSTTSIARTLNLIHIHIHICMHLQHSAPQVACLPTKSVALECSEGGGGAASIGGAMLVPPLSLGSIARRRGAGLHTQSVLSRFSGERDHPTVAGAATHWATGPRLSYSGKYCLLGSERIFRVRI